MRCRRQDMSRKEAGFTLLEVLVATAVLGTAVAALFSLLSGALANARRLEAPEQALLLARSQMNELLATQDEASGATALPLDQQVRGRWDDRYRWEAIAKRVPTPEQPGPGETIVVHVVLNTFWKTESGEQEKSMTLETYQLRREPVRSTP